MVRFKYNSENQLIQIDSAAGTVKYAYDGLGRRIQKDVAGRITKYVYDNEDIAAEYNASNVLQATWLHGSAIDEPISMSRDGQTYYYHADGLGSITDLTNSSGTVVQTYKYDAFGNIVAQTGTLTNPFTYTGREFDSESGLYFYRARYYDPRIGRFLQEDPMGLAGGDINFYVYARNNTTNLTDPTGLTTEADCSAIFNAELTICNEFFKDVNEHEERAQCYAKAWDSYQICKLNADDGPDSGDKNCPLPPSPKMPGPIIPPGMGIPQVLPGPRPILP